MEQNLKLFFKMTQAAIGSGGKANETQVGSRRLGLRWVLGPPAPRSRFPGTARDPKPADRSGPGLCQGTRVPAARASHPGGGLAAPQALHGLEEVPFRLRPTHLERTCASFRGVWLPQGPAQTLATGLHRALL